MPKHSIIIPCYNTQEYVGAAIRSCLAQTDADLEVIVVNDGSTDDSAKEIAAAAGSDKRVKVITQENKGLGAARNAGLQAAKGEYVNFLDADDLLEHQKLELQGKILDENPQMGLVVCGMLRVDANNQVIPLESCLAEPHHFSTHKPLADVLLARMFAPHVPLMRRELALKVGGFNTDREMMGAADMEFWLMVSYTGTDYAVVELPLVRYRKLTTSMSQDNGKMEHAIVKALESVAQKRPAEFAKSVRALQMELLWTHDSNQKDKNWLQNELENKKKHVEELWQSVVAERDQVKTAIQHAKVFSTISLQKYPQVYIWGAGSGGQRVQKVLKKTGIAAKGYIDSDPQKKGMKVEGIQIVSPEDVSSLENKFIFVASTKATEIEAQLKLLGGQSAENYFVVDFATISKYEEADFPLIRTH